MQIPASDNPRRPDRPVFLVSLLLALALGVGLSLLRLPGVFIEGEVHPLGNDSFYHAVRMLAIAGEPGSTHTFDPNLNAPEGLWITWPWAYDWLAGGTASLLASERGALMGMLAFYPLLWLIGSISLVALISREFLPARLQAVCVLAYAAAPPTLSLYGVGILDHHGAEHFWLLLCLFLAGRWLAEPGRLSWAGGLGVALAVATAFHNSLFILQIPVLLGFFLARLGRQAIPTSRAALAFGVGLVLVQVLVLLPSHAFRTGQYAFYLHGWFHLHCAVLTAIGLFAISLANARHMWTLLTLAALTMVPASGQLLMGLSYLKSELLMLDVLREARAPFGGELSWRQISHFYSGLIWLWPLCMGYALWCLARRQLAGMERMVLVSGVVGLALLLAQVRLFYFGYAFLVMLPLMMMRDASPRSRQVVLASALFVLAFIPSATHYTEPIAPGGSPRYTSGWPLIYAARAQCRELPGLLLADSNWGNFLRYQTDCPLVANNFTVSDAEVAAVLRSQQWLSLSPRELQKQQPQLRYVLVSRLETSPLADALLDSDGAPGYALVKEMKDRSGRVMGRLYRLGED